MKNKTLVPKLRFPEFVENWSIKSLGALGRFIGGGTPDRSEIEYWKGDIAWISSSDLIDDNLTEIKIRNYINQGSIKNSATKIVPKGSVLFVSRVGTGKLAINPIELCTSQDFTSLVPINVHNYYVGYYFLAKKSILSSFNQGTSIKGFSKSDLEKIIILLPSLTEQKKIADCLSSLDDLITAQTQKLETLKTYKKGLMQQLFPAEGETVPKLRFEGFEGEWEEKILSSLSEQNLSNGVFNDPKKVGKGYKLVNVLDMYIESTIDEKNLSLIDIPISEFLKNKVENGDLFFTRSSLVKSGIAHSNIYVGNSDDLTFDGHLIRFRPNKKIVSPFFVHYQLKSSRVRSQLVAKGKTATMTTIGQSDVASITLYIPKLDEQEKIATCFSSIDNLIAAQAQKIENLKLHKKGLMQQLFPSSDEVADE